MQGTSCHRLTSSKQCRYGSFSSTGSSRRVTTGQKKKPGLPSNKLKHERSSINEPFAQVLSRPRMMSFAANQNYHFSLPALTEHSGRPCFPMKNWPAFYSGNSKCYSVDFRESLLFSCLPSIFETSFYVLETHTC